MCCLWRQRILPIRSPRLYWIAWKSFICQDVKYSHVALYTQFDESVFPFTCLSVLDSYDEKLHIAHRHLLPKQILVHGLQVDKVLIPNSVLLQIATAYTREAGVRGLERQIAAVCRAVAVEAASRTQQEQVTYHIDEKRLLEILGVRFCECDGRVARSDKLFI
jgi:hypothetical protein